MTVTHAEKRAWILKIKDVKESDRGWYMCQINTDPMKSQIAYLDVVGKCAFNSSFTRKTCPQYNIESKKKIHDQL